MLECGRRPGPAPIRVPAVLAALAPLLGAACSGEREGPGPEASAGRAAERPNIVLVTLDTLRSDRTDPYGFAGDTTPFLSELASRGTVFERAFSTSSWTAPSTASIFTGLYPNEHGVIAGFRAHAKLEDNASPEDEAGLELPRSTATVHERMQLVRLPESRATLVEHLAGAGYATFGIATNLNIGSELGFDRGYDEFERMYLSPAAEVAERVFAWRSRLEAAQPYFLYLHLNDAHMPYEGRVDFGYGGGNATDEGAGPGVGVDDDLARYDSEIRYLDHWLGEMYRELGWAEDTALMIVSDHGEEFRDHGRTGHRYSLYAELNDVLMILAGPGIDARRVDDHNVSLIDVLPTLLDVADLAAPEGASGGSLIPLARGERPDLDPDRPVFAHRIRGGATEPLLERPPLWAVVAGHWKLIENGEDETVELYDTEADPLEQRDLAEERPEVVERLRAVLRGFTAGAVRHQGGDVQIDVDDELLRRLEELGYAGHD